MLDFDVRYCFVFMCVRPSLLLTLNGPMLIIAVNNEYRHHRLNK